MSEQRKKDQGTAFMRKVRHAHSLNPPLCSLLAGSPGAFSFSISSDIKWRLKKNGVIGRIKGGNICEVDLQIDKLYTYGIYF